MTLDNVFQSFPQFKGETIMKKLLVLSILVVTMLLGCAPVTPTATPTLVVPAPDVILAEVLQSYDQRCISSRGVNVVDSTYSFFCYSSADAGYTVSMTRYDSEAAAKAQFESGRGDNPVECFYGNDLYKASSKHPDTQPSRISNEELHWQAGQWVVSISSSYDYGFFHFTTNEFAEAVYAAGVEHGLFQAGTCP
jgi:hypothetical protein